MKRILLALLLTIGAVRASAYDFTAVCPSGQMLYYSIRNAELHTVAVVAPNNEDYPPYEGYTIPEGAIELSEIVEHEGITYTLTEIGPHAFGHLYANVHGDIIIPNTVTLIGTQAFAYSYFDGTISLGNQLVTIGNSAFSNTFCHGSVILPSTVEEIKASAFTQNGNLDGELILNEGLKSIGESAFFKCRSLHGKLRFPSTLTELGKYCFAYCAGFTGELVIPKGITVIPNNAFSECSGLEHLTLSEDLTEINWSAFEGCSGLTGTLTLPSGIRHVGSSAFSCCSNLTSLVLPPSLTNCGSDCFMNCTNLSGDIVIPEGTYQISMCEFRGCNNIEHIILPNSLKVIDSDAFYGCSGLSGNLHLPDSLQIINGYAFSGCSGLEGSLSLPQTLEHIGWNAFADCIGLTGDLIIPDKVQSVEMKAFYGCSNLGYQLTIGASVYDLGDRCFYGTGFDHVIFRNPTPPSANYSIGLGPSDCVVPCGGLDAYKRKFGDAFSEYTEEMLFKYEVTSNDYTLGNIAVLERPKCDNDMLLKVAARPTPGRIFDHWSINGDNAGDGRVLSLNLDQDYEIVAHFRGGAAVAETIANVDIYPTVTKDFVKVEADNLIAIEMYSLTGCCVATTTGNQIDISALPSGCYILNAHISTGIVRQKIIKM